MDFSLISRRQLLAAASAYAVLQATSPLSRANADTIRVRENVTKFAQSPQKVAALRAAVKRMKDRTKANKDDPLGWYYWSAAHGTNDTVPSNLRPVYNQCDHTSGTHVAVHFLSWHRAFLFFFEAVLKQAAVEAGVTTPLELPYWEWYSTPVIAKIFTEGNATTNPLFHARARTDISGWDLSGDAFTFDDMLPARGVPAARTFSISLEGNPHGTAHVAVGGDMGSVPTSARDPIFWLHHANIDRLWSAWMQGAHRVIPAAQSTWGNQPWSFDLPGNWHQTAGAMLDSLKAPLSYRYDDETTPVATTVAMTRAATRTAEMKTIEARPRSVDLGQLRSLEAAGPRSAARPTEVSATQSAVELGDDPTAVNLRLAAPEATQLNLLARAAPEAAVKSARLVLQDVEIGPEGKSGDFSYDIVASLEGSPDKPLVLGTLNTFTLSAAAHGEHAEHAAGGKQTYVFPLNDILAALGSETPGALAGGLKVTFRPSQPNASRANLLKIGSVKIEVSSLPLE